MWTKYLPNLNYTMLLGVATFAIAATGALTTEAVSWWKKKNEE